MIAVTLKGLAGRKLRAALTALAIVLGVAMVSGTYVLTDTISKGFDTIFAETYTHADAVIVGREGFADEDAAATESYPASVLAKVRGLPEVEGAEGAVIDDAQLVGADGKVIESSWGTAVFSVDPAADRRFNPLNVVQGDMPSGSGEIAIDRKTAEAQGLEPGDSIGVGSLGPVRKFRIAGLVEYGSVGSPGGAQIAAFELATAQQLFDKAGKLDEIQVRAREGVSERELIASIKPLLPAIAHVKTAAAQRESAASDVQDVVKYFGYFLLAFGGIALVVGGFVIANTLAITIAQRTRELATLRTLGASRRQVLASVVLEAVVVGAVASIAGIFVGLGLAEGLKALLDAIGVELPAAGTVVAARTIVVSLAVGVLVTLFASLRPALRATRVPAIAAVREGAVLPRSRLARLGPLPALAVGVVAVGVLAYGLFAGGLPTGRRLAALAVGVLLLFAGVAMIAPRLVPPLARVLGWPGTRLGGAAGRLARDNARRNPARTASTAAALMIGLALITFVATLGQGVRASFTDAVDELFVSDYTLVANESFGATSLESSRAAAAAPGVRAISEVRFGTGRAFDEQVGVSGVEPDLSRLVHMRWKQGDAGVPARLGAGAAFVTDAYADDHGLERGSRLRVRDGDRQDPRADRHRGLRRAARRLALRRGGDLDRGVRRVLPPAAERVHLHRRRRWRLAGRHQAARAGARALSRHEGADPRSVQGQPAQRVRDGAQPPLRAARALGPREPLRDRQHARADGVRAHARARDAASGGDDPAAGPPDGPPREHRDRADGHRPRHRSRALPGGARDARAGRGGHPVRPARRIARGFHDRRGRPRDPGRHPARPPRIAAERPGGVAL